LIRPDDPRPRQASSRPAPGAMARSRCPRLARRVAMHGRGQRPEWASSHAAYAAGQRRSWHTSPRTSSVLPPMRSRPPRCRSEGKRESAGKLECRWQRDQLPELIRELVLDDQRTRTTSAGRCSTAERASGAPALSRSLRSRSHADDRCAPDEQTLGPRAWPTVLPKTHQRHGPQAGARQSTRFAVTSQARESNATP